MGRGFGRVLGVGIPNVVGIVALIGIGQTPELEAAPPWAEVCREALHSRAPLAQCGALLALRDRAVDRPDEVVEAYLREDVAEVRRRMAMVLGGATLRRELDRRALRDHPGVARSIEALGDPRFDVREEATRALRAILALAEDELRRAAHSSDPERASRARGLLAPLELGAPGILPTADPANAEGRLRRWTTALAALDRGQMRRAIKHLSTPRDVVDPPAGAAPPGAPQPPQGRRVPQPAGHPGATEPVTPLPFWEDLDNDEQLQIARMYALAGRPSRFQGGLYSALPAFARLRPEYQTSREDPQSPWFEALRGVVEDRWPKPDSLWGWDDRAEALPYEPLAPLLRVVIHRRELMSGAPAVGPRRVLAVLGDARAVAGLEDAQAVAGLEDVQHGGALGGFPTVAIAEAQARIGRIEGVEALWRLLAELPKRPAVERQREPEQMRANSDAVFARTARRRVVESLDAVLDLGIAPVPGFRDETLRPWLDEPGRQALVDDRQRQRREAESREGWGNQVGRNILTRTTSLDELEQQALLGFARALRAAYDRERAHLAWSPVSRRFHPAGRPQSRAVEVHPGLVGLGPEDEAARRWYDACAARAFDPELSVAVGATRALMWGESAAAEALRRETGRLLDHGRPDAAALLRGVGRLLPVRDAPDPGDHAGLADLPRLLMRYYIYQSYHDFIPRNGQAPRNQLKSEVLREVRPLAIPFLMVIQETSPEAWELLMRLDAAAARPFLVRELARSRSAMIGSLSGQGWFNPEFCPPALFPAFVHYRMTEAVPTLILYASARGGWPGRAIRPLAELGGDQAIAFLRSQVGSQGPDGRDKDYARLIEIALARNGEAARLERCVELIRADDSFNLPRSAVGALKACLPFDGPDFAQVPFDPPPPELRTRVSAAWSDWLRQHRDRLRWDPRVRRYRMQDQP
jgi:hypothetical protein